MTGDRLTPFMQCTTVALFCWEASCIKSDTSSKYGNSCSGTFKFLFLSTTCEEKSIIFPDWSHTRTNDVSTHRKSVRCTSKVHDWSLIAHIKQLCHSVCLVRLVCFEELEIFLKQPRKASETQILGYHWHSIVCYIASHSNPEVLIARTTRIHDVPGKVQIGHQWKRPRGHPASVESEVASLSTAHKTSSRFKILLDIWRCEGMIMFISISLWTEWNNSERSCLCCRIRRRCRHYVAWWGTEGLNQTMCGLCLWWAKGTKIRQVSEWKTRTKKSHKSEH